MPVQTLHAQLQKDGTVCSLDVQEDKARHVDNGAVEQPTGGAGDVEPQQGGIALGEDNVRTPPNMQKDERS